jgi:3-mercaptopyruvate sulfurtransferase SseA
MSNLGIGTVDQVVIYGDQIHWAIQHCWWVLAVASVDVKLLNMSFTTWVNKARPIKHGQPAFTPSKYTAQPNMK